MADVIERLRGLVERATKDGTIRFEAVTNDLTPYIQLVSVGFRDRRNGVGKLSKILDSDVARALLIVAAVNALPALLAVAEAAKKYTASGGECDREDLRTALANLETHNG